jgi:putative ABC transport system permease protein
MTALAIALVVWATVLSFGLADGLQHALLISGEELDLIVLRKGSQDETSSTIDPRTAREIATLAGVARDPKGKPLCSTEFVTILAKPRRAPKANPLASLFARAGEEAKSADGGTTNVIVRGLDPIGRALRPAFAIVQGRDLTPGLNEAITSRRMAKRFQNMAIGEVFEINQVGFKIVGYFQAGGSAAESELWTDLRDLTGARRTPDAVSCVNLRARDSAAKADLIRTIQEDEQFNLKVVDEKRYFEDQMTASIAIKVVGYFIAAFLTVGAMFAAANTMYAAVASRSREIGMLRALGFPRRSILISFVLESILLCLVGGLIGCLATMPFHGLSTGTLNWATFSEITFSFRFSPAVLVRGVLLTLVMGAIGGLFPAVRAVRLDIAQAIREQ